MKSRQDEALALRLNGELLDRIRAAARVRGISVSDAAREAMNLWLIAEPSTDELIAQVLEKTPLSLLAPPEGARTDRSDLLDWLRRDGLRLAWSWTESCEANFEAANQEVEVLEEQLEAAKGNLKVMDDERKSAAEWLRRLEDLEAALRRTQDSDASKTAEQLDPAVVAMLDAWMSGRTSNDATKD